MILLAKILTTVGSVLSIGFGVWHFFVPKKWNWYAYIDPKATELILAVRAINIFFSLSLVLFGAGNLLLVYFNDQNPFSLAVMLALSSILWLVRCIVQIIYPQGSMSPLLQFGMLAAFIGIFLCFFGSLVAILVHP